MSACPEGIRPDVLTFLAVVTFDFAPVFGFGAVFAEVADFVTIAAHSSRGVLWLLAFFRHMSLLAVDRKYCAVE